MVKPVDEFDPWTALIHRAGIDPDTPSSWEPASWLDRFARRRMHGYRILFTYVTNSARFNRVKLSQKQRRKIREYGDPRVIVDAIVSGVLGDGAVFSVEGAQQAPPDQPDIPKQPTVIVTGDATVDAVVSEGVLDRWRTAALDAYKRWSSQMEIYPGRRALQEWVDDWVDVEDVQLKIYESEANNTVPLGDGVLVVGWDEMKRRPTLTVYEPDAYHPVLEGSNVNAYPDKVHLAWEYERDDGSKWLRRITYELVTLDDRRRYPWQTEAPSVSQTCLWSDMEWPLKVSGLKWPNLDDEAGEFNTTVHEGEEVPIDKIDLLIDFLPIIHIPNTPSANHHFGVSSLTNIAQILDDLADIDTDMTSAAALAGKPTVFGHGLNSKDKTIRPGTMNNLEQGGKLDTLDMSEPLKALMQLVEVVLDRLSINSNVPGVVLGRVSGADVPSGIALQLSFSPFEQYVAVLHLTRHAKYRLAPKFAIRMAQAYGVLDPGPTPRIDVSFSSTTPQDLASTVTILVALLEANGIPRRLALQVLRELGLHNGDIEEMLVEIAAEDFEGAKAAADATGSEQTAADLLGIEISDEEDPPSPIDGAPN